eukprot:TRINITY_DN20327_c0_g1_i1.p2 TRINITY_DN20327_c0_g1~~TRINITY_DN20327_c0_g1_i1.p2  ORF type:complete len:210 (+),score=59.62 TRINITY_DN20327_c0_g1_i1:100-729(+)
MPTADDELFSDELALANEPLGVVDCPGAGGAAGDDEIEVFDDAAVAAAGGVEAVPTRESKANFEMLVRKKFSRCGADCTLSNRCITDDEFEFILRELQRNPAVSTLDVGSNLIGNRGAEALAYFLRDNDTVTNIDLYGNEIADQGADALARALRNNQTLQLLDLRANKISERGVKALAQVKQVSPNVTIYHDRMTERGGMVRCPCCSVQ